MNNIMMPSRTPSPADLAAAASAMYIKPGCRGDPRMNQAVAAKLKNPKLPLFDALRIGGFHYPRNVDAATMDNDRVTLGQRKNQLNRRLRMARKNLRDTEHGAGNNSDKEDEDEGDSGKATLKPKVSTGSSSPLVIAGSYLRQLTRKTGGAAATKSLKTSKKRDAPAPTNGFVPSAANAKKQCLTTTNSSGELEDSRPSPQTSSKSEISLFNALFQSATTETHQHFQRQPHSDFTGTVSLADDEVASLKSILEDSGLEMVPDDTIPNAAMAGSQWPSGKGFGYDRQAATTNQQAQQQHEAMDFIENLVVTTPALDMIVANLCEQQQEQFPSSNTRCDNNARTNSIASVTTATTTATTSSCSYRSPQQDLLHWLQDPQKSQQQQQQQQQQPNEELGLRFFQAGLQELYQKSMMVAGFNPSDVMNESSKAYHQFAFQAWKRECERLQVVLKDDFVPPQP